ncbi:MAG: hypothetical protein IJF56_00490 [Clostridia bacterium]|nr:hypothetical protein [Clostridia bacterium]
MFPNGSNNFGLWGSDNYPFGVALFNSRLDFRDLPDEVKAYLSEHESEIRSEDDVDRLLRTYNLKK